MNCLYENLHLSPRRKDRFVVLKPYLYKDIQVPIGFMTNGANIPRVFWSVIPPNKTDNLPAVVVHDYLCKKEEYEKADRYFNEILMDTQVNVLERVVLVNAVKAYHKVKYGGKK